MMENKGNEHELMGSMKVSRAVAVMAIPSVISSLFTIWRTLFLWDRPGTRCR